MLTYSPGKEQNHYRTCIIFRVIFVQKKINWSYCVLTSTRQMYVVSLNSFYSKSAADYACVRLSSLNDTSFVLHIHSRPRAGRMSQKFHQLRYYFSGRSLFKRQIFLKKISRLIITVYAFIGLCINFLIVPHVCQMENANTTKIKLKKR